MAVFGKWGTQSVVVGIKLPHEKKEHLSEAVEDAVQQVLCKGVRSEAKVALLAYHVQFRNATPVL